MIRRNIVSGLLGQAVLVLLTLVVTRQVFRHLGIEVLGIINFSVVVTSLLILLADLGLSMLVSREVAANRNTDIIYARELARSIIVFAWIGFLISCVVVFFLAPLLIDQWLQFKELKRGDALLALQIISIALLFAIPRAIYGAVISGFERMDWWNAANVSATALQQIGLIVILATGGGIFQIAAWYVISAIVGLLFFMALAARFAGLEVLALKIHWASVKTNFIFARDLFANSLLGYLVSQADRWIISKHLPLSQLAYYGFAQSLVSKGAIVPGAIANAAFPALSASIAGDHSRWFMQYHKLQDFCCYVCVPVFAGVAILGVIVTQFVFNTEIALSIWLPLTLLAASQLMISTLYVPNWLAIAMKKPWIAMRTNIWALVIVLPLTFILIMQWGLLGAAFGAMFYSIWQLAYFIPRFSKECLAAPSRPWYLKTMLFLIACLFSYGAPSAVMFMYNRHFSITGLLILYTIGTFIFMILGWRLLCRELQDSMRQTLKNIAHK